jgi:hypothetical protein
MIYIGISGWRYFHAMVTKRSTYPDKRERLRLAKDSQSWESIIHYGTAWKFATPVSFVNLLSISYESTGLDW